MRALVTRFELNNVSHRVVANRQLREVLRSGRVQLALIASLLIIVSISFVAGSSIRAEDAPPTEEPTAPSFYIFDVDTYCNDPDLPSYRYTFTGSVINFEALDTPVVILRGAPFDATIPVDAAGRFEKIFVIDSYDGFGVSVDGILSDATGTEFDLVRRFVF